MMVDICFFAAARDITDCDRLPLELDERSTVADVQRALAVQFPELNEIMAVAMWSVNQEYASAGDPVPAGAEVGLILPVSGG